MVFDFAVALWTAIFRNLRTNIYNSKRGIIICQTIITGMHELDPYNALDRIACSEVIIYSKGRR